MARTVSLTAIVLIAPTVMSGRGECAPSVPSESHRTMRPTSKPKNEAGTAVAARQDTATASHGQPLPSTYALPPTEGDLGHPYNLPVASRARMHACGIEWQRMKMAGTAVDLTWRIFAAGCLADGNEEPPKSAR